jgi:REP-associated tyrosine transposase
MPARKWTGTAGLAFHVLNRAVRRARLFASDSDYETFLKVLAHAQERSGLRLLAYCVMPNHFHLVAWPLFDGQLSPFMHWLTVTHARRWHLSRGTIGTGSVYQSRFKAFPIQTDAHLLTVCRYVEQNALRAGLVRRAQDWRWSSASDVGRNGNTICLSPWPIPRPADYVAWVNETPPTEQLGRVRWSVLRSRPFGGAAWTVRTAADLGLARSLRPVGRPRRSK